MQMLIRITGIGAIAAVCWGCATPYDLSQKTPLLEFNSLKNSKEMASCISQEWSKHLSPISTLVNGDGFTVSLLHSVAGTDATVVILPSEKGCHVRYVERIHALSPSWMKEAVEQCK